MDLETEKPFIDTKTKSKSCNDKCKRIFQVLVVINIVLVIVLVAVFIVKHSSGDENNETELSHSSQKDGSDDLKDVPEDISCFPCEFLGDEVTVNDTLYDVIVNTDCNHKMCCLRDGGEVQNLIIQMILKEANGIFLPMENNSEISGLEWWRSRPLSAHVYGTVGTEGDTVPKWTNVESKVTSFVNDLVFENSSFHLTSNGHNGVYFIYSVVTLDVKAEKTLPFGFHQIVKMNKMITLKGEPIEYPLLMSKYGGSPMTSQWHTSFLCGTVKLQRNEVVKSWIHAGNAKYLDQREYSHFFGMYKL